MLALPLMLAMAVQARIEVQAQSLAQHQLQTQAQAANPTSDQTVDPAVILDAMAEHHYMPSLRAAFGNFTFEYTDLPTPFARWVEDCLATAAAASRRVQLLNRSAAAALDPAFQQEYASFIRETGSDALLHGRYFDEGPQVRVRLELTDLSSGTLIGTRDWLVPMSAVPAYAAVKAADDARARATELARLAAIPPGGLKVTVSTDRGSGAAYRNGEKLVALVTVNKDAYVRLYHVSSAGQLQLIWPNRFGGGDGLIKAGTTVHLPGPTDPFAFLLEPPFGTEFLKAVASTQAFKEGHADFTNLGTNYRAAVTRGLAVTATSAASTGPEVAEAMASYHIGP
jgi:hypothetical protein